MRRKKKNGIEWLEFDLLQKFPEVRHGVFGLGEEKNIPAAFDALGIERGVKLKQCHRADIFEVKCYDAPLTHIEKNYTLIILWGYLGRFKGGHDIFLAPILCLRFRSSSKLTPDKIRPVPSVCVIPLGIMHSNPPASALQNPIATPSGTWTSFLSFFFTWIIPKQVQELDFRQLSRCPKPILELVWVYFRTILRLGVERGIPDSIGFF
ncbi:hypothetical protein NEPTK9_001366 [Candidatus Neptunochlamydia vexilliferae]|uniref:Uncharacterized protein n=1 Tax=Candidatus Neptunichlamydia vexilliferae TaxID=1651774 RepID=A0ABS0B0F7_9BACT|nr:hypothetical protein [Candidatus Neptunochlamydia vexilliferae]